MKTILMIDDSIIQLRTIENLLKNDYRVLLATSSNEGVEVAVNQHPDVILLDYEMPVIDGRMTLKKLKSATATAEIPVIFLTGVNEQNDIKKVLDMKPAGYLLKPVEPHKLMKTLDRVLG